MINFTKRVYPALIAFLSIIFVVECLVRLTVIPSFLFPAPSEVLKSFFEYKSEYLAAFISTFQSTLIGLCLSSIVGICTAILFSLRPWLKKALLPFSVFFQTVPIIAIAPLMVIWFGFGPPTVRASAFIVSLFPILANTLVGIDSADGNLLELFRFYNASPTKILFKLKIPSAFPYIISGLKIGAGLSVIGAIVGEFVGGGGLGALIDSARTQQKVDVVFGAVLLSSVLGLVLIAGINVLNQLVLKLKPYTNNTRE